MMESYSKTRYQALRSMHRCVACGCPSGSYSHKHGEKHRGMFTKDSAKNRSKTFPGIAKAMAEQWAGKCEEE